MRIADPNANTNSHGNGDSDSYSYTDSYANGDSDSYSYTDSYAYGDGDRYAYTDSDANCDGDSNTYAYLRPGRVAIGSAPASGPLCLPRRPRHGQHALRRRRPDRRLRADRVRPGLAL